MTADVVSFGGGVQSTALLVLASRGEIDYRTFIFADVGEDSEDPGTVEYVREVSEPFAQKHGLDVVRVAKRGGESLLGYVRRVESSVPIPVRLPGAGPSRRLCTRRWKLEPVWRWQRDHGAGPDAPARCAVGISTDEVQRARSESLFHSAGQRIDYPLLTLGLSRSDCAALVASAGLPVPPRSSCWFCPMSSQGDWLKLRRSDPSLWAEAVELESMLADRRERLTGERAHFAGSGSHPLPVAIADQMSLWGDNADACDASGCFT